jgi:iron complex transport system ATP-binding protein
MEARELSARRGARTIIDNISLTLKPGEILGVLGANGAGKSTLLAALAGELPIAAGSIELDGISIRELSPQALARRRSVLPQSGALSFDLAVAEIVAMGAYPFPDTTPNAVRSCVNRALDLADAAHLHKRRYLHLSGGEQQRVQFARALVQTLIEHSPSTTRYLLLDEPTASLDPRHQQGLMRAITRLAEEEGLAVFAVLHDVNLAARWCDRLLLLADGKAAACGQPNEVLTPEVLRSVYQTEATVLAHPRDSLRPLVIFD